jgi:hypothetical protein
VALLLPLVALLAADAALAVIYFPPSTPGAVWVGALALGLSHAGAFAGAALFVQGTLASVMASNPARQLARRPLRGRLLLAVALALAFGAFDQLYGSTLFTEHYSPWIARGSAAAGAALVLLALLVRPDLLLRLRRRSRLLSVLTAVWCSGMCLAIGTSFHQYTTKHFREFGHALLLYPVVLLLLVAHTGRCDRRSKWSAWAALIGAGLFALGTAGASCVPRSSAYLAETRLVASPALRRVHRQLARPVAPWSSAVAERLVGRRRTPTYPAPTFGTTSCSSRGPRRVDLVLLLTFDALRADYYGLSPSALPHIGRLSERSIRFTKATSSSSLTRLTFYGMHTGLYPTRPPTTSDALVSAAAAAGAGYAKLDQGWKASAADLTERVLAEITGVDRDHPRVVHAHYLALHPPTNWAGSGFDYQGVLRSLDRELGRLLDATLDADPAARALLILTADHGEELGQERGYQGHGFDATETLLHVPLLVHLPGAGPATREDRVSSLDLFATILDGLGVSCALPRHGRSLLEPALPDRVVFASAGAPTPVHRPGRDLLFADTHAVYVDDWKLVLNRGANVFALFDLQQAPAEQDNQIDQRPRWADTLTGLLDQYLGGRPPLRYSGAGPARAARP